MAATFNANQLQITVSDKTKPDWSVSADDQYLLGHLGTGWSGSDWTGDAITATASVPMSNFGQAELGFVQIARANRFQAFYAGRLASEGAIILDYFIPPALTKAVMLDGGGSKRDPWYRDPVSQPVAGGRSASTGDHPGMLTRLQLQNRVCSYVPNYLFHVIMDRDFWTLLTLREPDGSIKYIGYYQWRVLYNFKVRWHEGKPTKLVSESAVTVGTPKAVGRPSDADIQAILDNPSSPRANELGNRTLQLTPGGSPPNRRDLTTRFANVPATFWS